MSEQKEIQRHRGLMKEKGPEDRIGDIYEPYWSLLYALYIKNLRHCYHLESDKLNSMVTTRK